MSVEHFTLLLRHLVCRDIDISAIQPPRAQPRPPPDYLPARLPAAEGDVTEAHVDAFAASFPRLGPVLTALIPWSGTGARRSAPAEVANARVRGLLGIGVDVRNGFLASPAQIDETVEQVMYWAFWSSCNEGDVTELLDRKLPRVRLTVAGLPAGDLHNAAWSCAVDKVLNMKEAWRPD